MREVPRPSLLSTVLWAQLWTGRPTMVKCGVAVAHYSVLAVFGRWELVEMLKRFVLVGLMVLMQDTMMQLFVGLLLSCAFLLLQVSAQSPFTRPVLSPCASRTIRVA